MHYGLFKSYYLPIIFVWFVCLWYLKKSITRKKIRLSDHKETEKIPICLMFFTNKNNNQSVKSTSQQTKSIQMAMANIEITWIDYICVIQQQRQLPG